MSQPEGVVIGIDLGTTFSVAARIDSSGRPRSIANAEGDLLTPSAVYVAGDEIVVGKEAIKLLATEAGLIAQHAKRELGERAFHRPLGGENWPPEALQACVLRKLARDVERQYGPIRGAVVTVPAYFDEVRRRMTHDAGRMAGLDVWDIINEPTAAAIAFGHEKGYLHAASFAVRGESPAAPTPSAAMASAGSAPGGATPEHLVVYDLGGGTFDVTVLRREPAELIALATDGDVRLGGVDWNERLVEHAAAQFVREFDIDPREDAVARARLERECEDAKRTLSTRNKVTIAFDWQGKALRIEVTLRIFEELTRDLLDRTGFTARQAVRAAGLAWPDIDRVLLVGGATRMPMVRHLLLKLSGREPDVSISADEAVAHGAALWAEQIAATRRGQTATFHLRNVNSHSLGVLATDPVTRRRQNAVVIPRNTPLPVSARRVFRTQKDNQKSLLVQIVEGESLAPDGCAPIGRCVVRDLPPRLPAGTPIDVRFGYLADGLLRVAVNLADDERLLEAEIVHHHALTPEEISQWGARISRSMRDPDGEDAPLADTL